MLSQLQSFFLANPVTFIVITGLYGLLVGSFLNVVIHRLPKMLEQRWRAECQEVMAIEGVPAGPAFNLITPRSRCPHCSHKITALQNIPVISYLMLRGKCAGCGAPISARYPLIELLTAALSMVVAWHFGAHGIMLAALVLTWSLIALTFIDYDTYLLPDVIVLPILWLGLLLNTGGLFVDLHAAVIGAALAYLFLWIIFWAFKILTGKEGMGFGDFKLFALFGAWLGWQQLPLLILLAAAAGAVIGIAVIVVNKKGRDHPIPFGPFLAIAGFISLIWGEPLMRAYMSFLRL